MIPGSHRLGLQKHSSDEASENYILTPVDPAALDESSAVDIELAPGDISVHHPLLLHGSQPNTSKRWRRGGSIQYIPATTRITKEWPCAFMFRGDAIEGINTYQPIPKYIKGEHMAFEGSEAWG
jgi:ectoine hydroxylase-related dioxygenase (phytanoyl-CoA dioxygenase family)